MRCLRILLAVCLALPLIGCGGSPTTEAKKTTQAKPEPKPAQS